MILLLLLTQLASASVSPVSIGLREALKKGIDYSSELKKAQSQIKGAEAETSKNRGLLFPTISGVGAASNKQNSATYTTGLATSSTASNVYQLGLTLTQPLYKGGLLTSGLSYYKTAEDLTRQNYYSVKQVTINYIVSAYYLLAQTQQLLDASVANKDILKSYMDITSQYERIGRSRKIDKLQARVNYSLAQADFETAQNNYKNSLSQLNKLLGEPNDSELKAAFTVVISPVSKISLDTAFKLALRDNPEIKKTQLAVEQIDYSKDMDLALDWPSLDLVGSGGYQAPDTGALFNSASQYYSVGLSLTVPIFTGLSSFSKRSSYAEKKYQAEKDLQIAKDALRSNLENALHTLNSTSNQLELSQSSVKEARIALEMANKGYRQGTASSQDVLNLQNTRYNAEKLFINSQFNYLQALLQLRQYMGIDLEKAYAN